MPTFELDAGGKTFEIEAPNQGAAVSGFKQYAGQSVDMNRVLFGGGGEPAQKPEAPITAEGAYRAADMGLQRGVAGLAGLPKAVGALGAQGIQGAANWAARKLGLPEDTRDVTQDGLVKLPTSEEALATIQKDFGGQQYTPQNRFERYMERGGEMLPNAAFPGGMVARAANVIFPAIGAQTAQEMGGGELAQAAGGLVGAGAANKIANSAARVGRAATLPSGKQVADEATRGYQTVDNMAVTTPVAKADIDSFASNLKSSLHSANKRPANVPGIYEEIGKLPDNGGDLADLVNLRRNIRDLPKNEQHAAKVALPKVEAEIERLAPGTMEQLTTAEKNYNAAKVWESLNKKMAAAEIATGPANSGLNLGNKLRAAAASVANNERLTRYMKPGEVAELERIAKGTLGQNALRQVGNILGGGGGIGTLVPAAILGGGAYGAGGDPMWGLAAPFIGRGARGLYNRSVAQQAANPSLMALARSPLAQQMGVGGIAPQSSLPGATVRGLMSPELLGLPPIQ